MATVNAVPNALTQFFDNQGKPLVNGKVYFYQPNTNPPVPATTWQDPFQNVTNPNPVQLDANGRAPIFGVGPYRQVVYDQNSNLIWDSNVSGIFTSSASGAVGAVFGRTGLVSAQQGDYTPSQIGTAAQGAELSGISNITGTGFVERTDLGAYITVANGIPPFGPAGGDLAGNYPNPVLVATNVTPGTYNGGKGFAVIIAYF